MADRPLYIPFHDTQLTNITLPQDSLYRFSGYPEGLPVPSSDHNGKYNSAGSWLDYVDQGGLRNPDWLDVAPASVLAITQTALTYADGGNITTTGGIVATRAAYIFEGNRLETDDALLNPIGSASVGSPLKLSGSLTLPGRVWVYVSSAGVLRIESVGAAVNDSPAGDEMTLAGHAVDVLGVLNGGPISPITMPLPSYLLQIVSPLRVSTGAARSLNATSSIATSTVFVDNQGAGSALSLESNGASFAFTLEAAGTGGGADLLCDSASPALNAVNGGSGVAGSFSSSGTGGSVHATNGGAGPGVFATNTGTGAGVQAQVANGSPVIVAIATGGDSIGILAIGDGAGAGVNATGGASGPGVHGTSVGVADAGVQGDGAASSGSSGVAGFATHNDAAGTQGQTTVGATTLGAGVKATGLGDGNGLRATATDGYAATFTSDTTSPTRAAIRLTPQNDDPTTPLPGDIFHNSARANGVLRTESGVGTNSVHMSPKGWIKAWGAKSSGGPIAGGSGPQSLVQISPEEIGEVLLTVTVDCVFSITSGLATLTINDTTSAVIVATTSVVAPDRDGTPTETTNVPLRGIRVLPNTSTRNFSVTLTANTGSVSWDNLILSIEGVQ